MENGRWGCGHPFLWLAFLAIASPVKSQSTIVLQIYEQYFKLQNNCQIYFCCGVRSRTWDTRLMRPVGNHPPRNMLSLKDSNLSYVSQIHVYYRYTKGQYVPKVGLEPTRLSTRFLRPPCIPFHHSGIIVHPRKDSNLHSRFWRPTFYQLNYIGVCVDDRTRTYSRSVNSRKLHH